MGLLLPAHRGDNRYFYYDVEQFYDFYAISIFPRQGRRWKISAAACWDRIPLRRLDVERQKLEYMDFVLSSALHNLEFGPAPDMVPQTAWFEREYLLALPAEELEALTASLLPRPLEYFGGLHYPGILSL